MYFRSPEFTALNQRRHQANRNDGRDILRVGVIGGGSAGYLSALALKTHLPFLDVELVQSKDIPIIGVGESTVPLVLTFLHQFLGFDVGELFEKVRPTIKQGIRLDWGQPGADYHINVSFDGNRNEIGLLGAYHFDGNVNSASEQALLMELDRLPVFRDKRGNIRSLMNRQPFAYHLDNARLVHFLMEKAEQRGVKRRFATLTSATLSSNGESIEALRSEDGDSLEYDLYIDCSGFRSFLLGEQMKVPFQSFASSLFTDSALTFERDHGGNINTFTSSTSMNAGWTWTIPMPDEDHHGYVFSSAFIDNDAAETEIRARYGDQISETKLVRFRSGRRDVCWKGNVVAVGNSYGFVEPLESSALMMICSELMTLVEGFPARQDDRSTATVMNHQLGIAWDQLRGWLACHYRFNRRFDTPFWQAARHDTDLAQHQTLIEMYEQAGPLTCLPQRIRKMLARNSDTAPSYGTLFFDLLMMGCRAPGRVPAAPESEPIWRARRDLLASILATGLPQAEALPLFADNPDWLLSTADNASWLDDSVARQGIQKAERDAPAA